MQPQQDYKQLLSEVIKKQIVILGPDITLAKARNVPGIVIADDGTVTDIAGNPQELTQKLIDQFVQLSGEIVKKTMEPLLTINQTPPTTPTPDAPTPAVTPHPVPPQPLDAAPTVTSIPTAPQMAPVTPAVPPTQTTQQAPTPQSPSPVQTTLAQQTNSVS